MPIFLPNLSGGWSIAGSHLDIHNPRVLAMVAAQRHFIEAESHEYASANVSGAAFCRFAVLMVKPTHLLKMKYFPCGPFPFKSLRF